MTRMKNRSLLRKKLAVALLVGGWMFQAGCISAIQQNIEVVFATPANLLAVPSAFLVRLLGPGFLKYFN